MANTPPFFPKEAIQAAGQVEALPQLFDMITNELPFTHKNDWIVVLAFGETLGKVVQAWQLPGVQEGIAAAQQAQVAQAAAAKSAPDAASAAGVAPGPEAVPAEGETPPPALSAVPDAPAENAEDPALVDA